MEKRSRSESSSSDEEKEDKREKKIRRLKKKLRKAEKKKRRQDRQKCNDRTGDNSEVGDFSSPGVDIQFDDHCNTQLNDPVNGSTVLSSTKPVEAEVGTEKPSEIAKEVNTVEPSAETALDAAILDLLGKRLVCERSLAPAMHNDIVVRWEEILKKGLPSEEKENLLKKYQPPDNCLVIDPPKLNPIVKTSLQEATIKRDDRIREKQEKITACLAAVAMILSRTILEFKGQEVLVERVSDIGRLLADLQYNESEIRRNLILASLNAKAKVILSATIADEWLFGKDLEEKVKAAKSLESSSMELKSVIKPQYPKNSKNSKAPPQQTSSRQYQSSKGGKRASYPGKQRNQSTSGYQKPSQKSNYQHQKQQHTRR